MTCVRTLDVPNKVPEEFRSSVVLVRVPEWCLVDLGLESRSPDP